MRIYYKFIVYKFITSGNSMGEEVITFVRIPISDIEKMVRGKHNLPNTLVDVRIEGDALLLYFTDKDKTDSTVQVASLVSTEVSEKRRRRRARHKRNRMKTHGWDIVARTVNQRGQACTIYKPFVDALSQPLSTEEQKAVVTRILKSNKNKPSEASINYFLENTLEYLNTKENATKE
jgi:hypothetical protein